MPTYTAHFYTEADWAEIAITVNTPGHLCKRPFAILQTKPRWSANLPHRTMARNEIADDGLQLLLNRIRTGIRNLVD
jgi:hypothetical protein